MVLRFYRTPALSQSAGRRVLNETGYRLSRHLRSLRTEFCFYVDVLAELSPRECSTLQWLLAETFEPFNFGQESFLGECGTVLEIGPRLTFETPFSSNAVAICHKCGVTKVRRLERSVRYGLEEELTEREGDLFLEPLHDRMTQERYRRPRQVFAPSVVPDPVRFIDLMGGGLAALERANRELGLAMDEQDLLIWYQLFVETLGRNPTDVELFQIGQANSEHSRHGWFKGRHIIDGVELPESPMDIVRATWRANPDGSLIAFADNSSAIAGYPVEHLRAGELNGSRIYRIEEGVPLHPTLTAETHNHPSGVEPFEGAGTGTGGRIRDNQMVGRGGFPMVGGAGYCSANLRIPAYPLPWEEGSWQHPPNLAAPLEIMIRASDGASYYGNCFGEPLVYGFARTFEMGVAGERRAWFKPLMYSVGAGAVRDEHLRKSTPERGMLILLLGGPGFRIGVGGGSASSMIAGANTAELDFASVQRSNPEMENRVNRVITACINMGQNNPIESAHDLGAGGTCNALPEIADPAGARIDLRSIPVADPTLSVREIWGNESQERNVILIRAERLEEVTTMCERESCPFAVVGEITGDGGLVLYDRNDGREPVHLPLEQILGKLPRKVFKHERVERKLQPLVLPEHLSVREALERVLRLPSVASKRWLTNKVDRSVTGLVAQQQCVGPNHTPLADFASRADSYFGLSGAVMSLGEQPVKGLINPAAMARLAVAEALLNLSGAVINDPRRIKCSGNWMWAAKLTGEGPNLIEAARAARDIMIELGIAIDGGKDSLSMAAKAVSPAGMPEVVKAPGQFVVAAYASTSDVTKKATPDLKSSGNPLIWVDCGFGKARLGGSALAQVFNQVGEVSPDVDHVGSLAETFAAVQELVADGSVRSVHDVSDGGLVVALLEMAFAGNFGLDLDIAGNAPALAQLFAEEPGIVMEIRSRELHGALDRLDGLPHQVVGYVGGRGGRIRATYNGEVVLDEHMTVLRAVWEETSNRLERLQANPECVTRQEEANGLTTPPPYRLTFTSRRLTVSEAARATVALVREEGTNGDREMAAALILAGFEVWDVTMRDLVGGEVTLDEFRGVVFPGGFSFADVLDSGKGWAGVIRFNPQVAEQFERFRHRPDTFSLSVCNGCQLVALLGWVPGYDLEEADQPRFIRNESERFESRFATVRIEPGPAIMLRGMAGSILGIWVAHGEGRLLVPDEAVLQRILTSGQAPVRYVDSLGQPTTQYPHNPNGSPMGIAALCSADGRHLAMMPHPERTVIPWQWPWVPEEWQELETSPWLHMFNNAYEWCAQSSPS